MQSAAWGLGTPALPWSIPPGHIPLPWSSLCQCPFVLSSEMGGRWGGKESQAEEMSALIPSTSALCIFQEREHIFPLFILLLLNSDP